tara:strand:- start:204 stop:542 length:339 start_codon:yes stop_codon:yes gene_type:complete
MGGVPMGSIKTLIQRALKFLKARILPSSTQPDEPLANKTPVPIEPVPIEPVSVSSIDELGLSPRLFNCLSRAGIHNIEALVSMSEEDLLNIRGLGVKALAELKERLSMYMRP